MRPDQGGALSPLGGMGDIARHSCTAVVRGVARGVVRGVVRTCTGVARELRASFRPDPNCQRVAPVDAFHSFFNATFGEQTNHCQLEPAFVRPISLRVF